MNNVDKVKRVLDKGVMAGRGRREAQMVWFDIQNGATFALLKNGRWMGMSYADDLSDLTGEIGGYNRNVEIVVLSLYRLGAITAAQRNDFIDWYDEQTRDHNRQQDLAEAKSAASRLGMKLVPITEKKS